MATAPKTITCEDTTWLVSDARERPLTDDEKNQLQHHIAGCERCQRASRQFSILFRQLRAYFGKEDDS